MRVIHWTPGFAPGIGGIEVLLGRLLPALRTRGHECLVIANDNGEAAPGTFDESGTHVRRFPFTTALAQRDVGSIASLQRDLIALIGDFRPDVSHLHHAGATAFFHMTSRRGRTVPSVMTVHTPCDDHGADTAFARSLRAATRVTAVSASTLRDVLALVPDVGDRASVIYNGVPAPRVVAAPIPTLPAHVVYVGRLSREKGVDVALRAFARVRRVIGDVRLTIAGDGPERAALERLALAESPGGAVTFTGAIPPHDVPALMNTATVLVVPSRWREPFGLVAIEAALLARPVVAARTGGLVEVVDDGITGRLFEPEDDRAMADALLEVLSGAGAVARQMGEAGRARAAVRFGLEACADAYDRLYGELA